MKKLLKIFLIIVFALFSFTLFDTVNAKSIANYREELAALKAEKAKSEANVEATRQKIKEVDAKINKTELEIQAAEKEMEALKEEIKQLEEEITRKEEQIKDLVVFLQVSNGESFYLKYLFGAENFTDLIYRIAVIEQLTSKNDDLVDEMNALIKENNLKVIELEAKEKELTALYESLQKTIASLGVNLSSYLEDNIDIDDQIKAMNDIINFYINEGCSETQDVSKCSTSVPYDYGFDKPLKTGKVTDEFGMRLHPTRHVWALHTGIDLGGNNEGTNIYAPAAGKVVAIYWRQSCGGNMLLINHIVNGSYYTTEYMHMLSINVKVGDIVSKGQVIGTVGGGWRTSSYETCSTGAHLHFMISKGHYLGSGANSYSSYWTFYSNLFNPRDIIWFPDFGVYW